MGTPAVQLSYLRDILARFDWEHMAAEDRAYALGAVARFTGFGDTLRIDAIRRVLGVLESETGDRQYALETIDKIISDAPGLVIAVEVRDVYGVSKVYPADPTARHLAELAGTRTFTPRALDTIRRLGYIVEVHAGPYPLPAEYTHPSDIIGPNGHRRSCTCSAAIHDQG
jgi:hypothetical protein